MGYYRIKKYSGLLNTTNNHFDFSHSLLKMVNFWEVRLVLWQTVLSNTIIINSNWLLLFDQKNSKTH